MMGAVIEVSAEDVVEAGDRKTRLREQLGKQAASAQQQNTTTAIARVGEDPIAQAVRSMFGYMQADAEEIARQKKTKVNDTAKRKFESLIQQRIHDLRKFVRDKVVPRIEMFTDRLEATNDDQSVDKKKELVLLNRKLDEINSEEKEELEALKQEVTDKFQKKRARLEEDKGRLDDEVRTLEREHTGRVKRLKVRLESRLSGFEGFVSQMQTTATEMLWAQCTNLHQVQVLMERVPSSAGFMDCIAGMAMQSGDRALQVLLAGSVEERQDWFCDGCQKFTALSKYTHDGEVKRPDGTNDYDHGENKGYEMQGCGNCKKEWPVEDMKSLRCPFRMKTHEIIRITEQDAKGADIWEYLNGGGSTFGDEDQTLVMDADTRPVEDDE